MRCQEVSGSCRSFGVRDGQKNSATVRNYLGYTYQVRRVGHNPLVSFWSKNYLVLIVEALLVSEAILRSSQKKDSSKSEREKAVGGYLKLNLWAQNTASISRNHKISTWIQTQESGMPKSSQHKISYANLIFITLTCKMEDSEDRIRKKSVQENMRKRLLYILNSSDVLA